MSLQYGIETFEAPERNKLEQKLQKLQAHFIKLLVTHSIQILFKNLHWLILNFL
jgi:hypothetical protein